MSKTEAFFDLYSDREDWSDSEIDDLLGMIRAGTEPPTLAAFVELTSPWKPEPWQELICNRLEQLTYQKGARILLHGPPQFGKSLLVSQRFPCWMLGCKPDLRIRLACYNISHAERFSRVNLALMRSPEYLKAFPSPACRIPSICAAEEWSTAMRASKLDAQPSFKALGLGTGLVGLGSDLCIIDDPYRNFEEAQSDATNENIWDWWTKVFVPRLTPETNVVVMYHRWGPDDFSGRLIEEGGWEEWRFPAIADRGANDPTGRQEGESLSPKRYPVEFLRSQEERDPQGFLSLYQGTPIRSTGNLIQVDRIKHAVMTPLSADYPLLTVYQGWDLAIDEKAMADYTVCATIGIDTDQNVYLLDIFRNRMDLHNTMKAMEEQAKMWGPQSIAIESTAYQAAAFKEASRRFMLPFKEVKPSKDKVVRAQLLAHRVAMGKVLANKTAEWWGTWKTEAQGFPYSKKKDQIDATAHALNLHPVNAMLISERIQPSYMSITGANLERKRRQQLDVRSRLDA